MGQGYLRECDLENFVSELVPSLKALESLQADFIPFYVFTVVRKFMFFLDPRRSGAVSIKDILTSPFLSDLLSLRHSPNLSWFSADSAIKVYMSYLEIDLDGNGMLSQAELLKYSHAMLTPAIVERIFQEYMTYQGELDYKGFLDLILTIENKDTEASKKYIWKLLDTNRSGYIQLPELRYFVQSVVKTLAAGQPVLYKVDDLCSEFLDMFGIGDVGHLTWSDLVKNMQSGNVLLMLVDAHAFYLYDNRESLLIQKQHDAIN